MSTKESISILKECDAGVKMALASLDDVWEHVQHSELRAILNTTRAQHQSVGREIQLLLEEYEQRGLDMVERFGLNLLHTVPLRKPW